MWKQESACNAGQRLYNESIPFSNGTLYLDKSRSCCFTYTSIATQTQFMHANCIAFCTYMFEMAMWIYTMLYIWFILVVIIRHKLVTTFSTLTKFYWIMLNEHAHSAAILRTHVMSIFSKDFRQRLILLKTTDAISPSVISCCSTVYNLAINQPIAPSSRSKRNIEPIFTTDYDTSSPFLPLLLPFNHAN